MTEFSSRHLEAFRRFLSLLPHGKDPELVLLKGHLLIEEQIRALIDCRLQNPQALKEANARLDTHQAIQLAKAFFPPGHMVEIWRAVSKLNTLRNNIAHNLVEKGSLADRIEAWVQSLPTGAKDFDDSTTRFEITLWALFEAVSSLVDDSGTWGFDKESYGESESAS
ncbi:hypothetical protein [Rhodoferax lithotrophicus]|nr:hypothetical protein [Rhodoferax sp. MIZ03]